MTQHAHRTEPDHNLNGMPRGVPFIIGNELAERFSFYGMRGILTVFMTRHLLDAAGHDAFLTDENAKGVYHLFTAGAYFCPLLGAIISDVLWGKYKTILLISLMYCAGHGMLALMDLGPVTGMWDMAPFLYLGLALIAIGAGGIKPCVSAHVGDQFGRGNKHLLTQVFNWFYFSINLGAAASNVLTPILLATVGPWMAFGLPGVLMGIATLLFWMGRNTFIHVPPSGGKKFMEETFSPAGLRALRNLAPLFLVFVPVFWAIFDQTGSAWVLQAEALNRDFLGMTWLESQVQIVNPLLILTLIPVFTYGVYPFMARFFEPTPLRKIGIGFLLSAASFAVSALIESSSNSRAPRVRQEIVEQLPASLSELESADPHLDKDAMAVLAADPPAELAHLVRRLRRVGYPQDRLMDQMATMPSIGWQFLGYFLLTAGEVMVSIVCLEFAYTQSPPKMKSFIMGVYFLGVSLGNLAVSALNFVLDMFKDSEGQTPLSGPSYYWFFAGLMLVTTCVYVVFARTYQGETYIQGEKGA